MATHGTPPTDAELLRRARDDREAFDELYRRYAPQVRRWFARRTGSEAVALDLTAETFAAAFVAVDRFRDEADGSAEPWLHGIARNLLAGYRRSGAIETRARERLARREGVATLDSGAEADGRIDAARLAPRLDHELRRLPPDQQRAVTGRVVEERGYAELAAASGVSEAALRQRVARGLRTLRERLGTAAIVVAAVIAAAAIALPGPRAAAQDSIERLGRVLGLGADAGGGHPAALPAWVGRAGTEARELARGGSHRLLVYRPEDGGLCVVLGAFREECDEAPTDDRWRAAFAGHHMVLRGPWSALGDVDYDPAKGVGTAPTTLFGLVDDRVARVRVEFAEGEPADVDAASGGFVVSDERLPRTVVALDETGTELERMAAAAEAPYCGGQDCSEAADFVDGPFAVFERLARLSDQPPAYVRRWLESMELPGSGTTDLDRTTLRRVETGVAATGDLWLVRTGQGVCFMMRTGAACGPLPAAAPFSPVVSKWGPDDPTILSGIATDDVQRIRVTIGLDTYDVGLHDNAYLFVVPGPPAPEMVEPTSYELTLADGRVVTTR